MTTVLDLPAYLRRIGHHGHPGQNAAALRTLHEAHASHIPFENLDVLDQQPIRLDLAAVQEKLVARDRGGYCFEHNLLFAAVLECLGFTVRRLAARVLVGGPAAPAQPRTHMLLLVDLPDGAWLADVGFGAAGLLHPVPFVEAAPAQQHHWVYRIVAHRNEPDQWILQQAMQDRRHWQDLYGFTLQEQQPVDYEMANHYVSTHPDSRFVHTLTAQLPTPSVRWLLRGRDLTADRGTEIQHYQLPDAQAVARALREVFGIVAPEALLARVLR